MALGVGSLGSGRRPGEREKLKYPSLPEIQKMQKTKKCTIAHAILPNKRDRMVRAIVEFLDVMHFLDF